MAHPLSCPHCNRRINIPKATRCPSFGARLTQAVAALDDEGHELVEDEGFEFVEDDVPPSAPAERPRVSGRRGRSRRQRPSDRCLFLSS
jgi:hypothetical protein